MDNVLIGRKIIFDELEHDIRAYVAALFSGESTAAPYVLSLYFDVKEYNKLLVSGGLLEQPSWLWQMVKKAGIIYKEIYQEFEEQEEFDRITKQAQADNMNAVLEAKYQERI